MLRFRSTSSVLITLTLFAVSPTFAQNAANLSKSPSPHGEIIWEKYGVPHIYGRTTEDVLFGYGVAHMENHAETILRKVAAGRGCLAEYFGAGAQNSNITSDIQIRTFDIPRRSLSWLAEGTEEQRSYLRVFCAGLNAYASRPNSGIDPSLAQVLPIVPTDILDVIQETVQFDFMLETWNLPALITSWQAAILCYKNQRCRPQRKLFLQLPATRKIFA